MRVYKSRFCCKNTPMFLRLLAPTNPKFPFRTRGNKFSVSCLIRRAKAVKQLRSSNNVYADAINSGLNTYAGIEGYHCSIEPNRALESTTGFSFGLELETVAKSPQIFSAIYDGRILNSNWIFCSRDGSLPSNAGVELATIPLPSAYALDLQLWKDTTKHLRQYLYAAPDPACGLHVHVGTQYLLPSHPLYGNAEKWNDLYYKVEERLSHMMNEPRKHPSAEDAWRIPASLLITTIRAFQSSSTAPHDLHIHQSKMKDFHLLYSALRDLSNVSDLPKVIVKYTHNTDKDLSAWVKTANCTSPAAHLTRSGVSFFKSSPSSEIYYSEEPKSHSYANNTAEHRLHQATDNLSYRLTYPVLNTGYIAMAERSGSVGTRVNSLRACGLLDSDERDEDEDNEDNYTNSPFLTALFGRNTQHYCGFVSSPGAQLGFEGFFANLHRSYPRVFPTQEEASLFRQDIQRLVATPIREFADYLITMYGGILVEGPNGGYSSLARKLLYATFNSTTASYGEHGTRYAYVYRQGCSKFFDRSMENTYRYLVNRLSYDAKAADHTIPLLATCYAYLQFHLSDPQEYLDIINKEPPGSLVWIIGTMNLACILESAYTYCAPCSHGNELTHTHATFEFRRGKSTLNPNRIHSILTFLYYFSSAAAATPITPVNAPEVAKQLVRALVTQTHSPLLAHYAATCFPPSLTGLTGPEALLRRAPVLADIN